MPTTINDGQTVYDVRESPEDVDRLILHAGRPVAFITVHPVLLDTPIRVNAAFVHSYA